MISFLRFCSAKLAPRSLAWLALLLMALPWLAQAQCPTDDVILSSQAQVDAFPAGCTDLSGRLSIQGDDITNLNKLKNLQSVGGDLSILGNAQLTSIAPLTTLTRVGGDVAIFNTELTSLNGLYNLQSVSGNVRMIGNLQLTGITALTALTRVGGDVQITTNPVLLSLDGLNQLQSVGGSTRIINNAQLSSIAALTALTRVGRDVQITSNGALTSLQGLNNLQPVRSVRIFDNPQLAVCALSSICRLIATLPPAEITFYDNAPGCGSVEEVQANCLAITTQPAAGATACAGSSVTATVSASGSGITYQWYRGNQPVSGQTSATLTLTNVQLADAGTYVAMVSNLVSSLTSTAFNLTVNPLPVVSATPSTDVCDDNTADLTRLAKVNIPGSTLTFFSGFGAANPVANPSAAPAGTYTVQAISPAGCRSNGSPPALISVISFSSRLTINNLSDSYCHNAAATTLAGSPSGGSFTIDGQPATQFNPSSLSVGNHTVRYTPQLRPCLPKFVEQTVEIKASPNASFTGLAGPYCANAGTVPLVPTSTGGIFSGPGISGSTFTPANAGAGGMVSYSLTVNGCNANSSQSVVVNQLPSAPALTASATTTNQPISVTATGCTGGTINWNSQGGNGSTDQTIYTFTQPGSYTLSATCTLGTCTSPRSQALQLQILPGSFAITGVTMVNCQLADPDRGRYQVSFSPQYSAANANPISFSVVNELLPTTSTGPYSLRLYSDNPAITLVANQPGNAEARYRFAWLQACPSGTSPNRPPTTSGISNQTLLQQQPYQLRLTDYVTDPDGQVLTFQASGLPTGLSLNGSLISGSPTSTGVSTVGVTALDPGGLSVSTTFQVQVNPQPSSPSGFTIVGVSLVSCEVISAGARRLTFTPQYGGLNGSPVSFSVVNEMLPTSQPGPYSLRLYTDNPAITLSATQGQATATYRYNWLGACSGGARLGSQGETSLSVVVLGNPVAGQTVSLEVRGAEGQPLWLQLTDSNGRPVSERSLERAGVVEHQTLSLGHQPAGLLLLRVSTPTQRQTLKLLKVD